MSHTTDRAIYDRTSEGLKSAPRADQPVGPKGAAGYAIHTDIDDPDQLALYEDDGRGNGNFIVSGNPYWIRRIAESLVYAEADGATFTHEGWRK